MLMKAYKLSFLSKSNTHVINIINCQSIYLNKSNIVICIWERKYKKCLLNLTAMDPTSAFHRRQAMALYDGMADTFGQPVKTGVNPARWSPAKLTELASEAFRRKNFGDEWVDAGGMTNFARGLKFDGGVLRRVTEEDYAGFRLRIAKWWATNPRSKFPPLPQAVQAVQDESSEGSVGSGGGGGADWSIEELVQKAGNGKGTSA